MLDWDDFDFQEFDEEELRIRQEQKRREEEQLYSKNNARIWDCIFRLFNQKRILVKLYYDIYEEQDIDFVDVNIDS